jgi:hypothetical protein
VLVAIFLDIPKLMTDYIKKFIKTIRLNSFHHLCETEIWQNAIKEFNFPSFIDVAGGKDKALLGYIDQLDEEEREKTRVQRRE